MIKKLYYWFHKKISRPEERGESSAGRWQDMVRTKALELCGCKQGNVLEVGCGEGLFLSRLSRKLPDVSIYGADISEEMLAKAAKRGIPGSKFFRIDGSSLPFADNFFDTVFLVNVTLAISSEGQFALMLKELARVCKKNGSVIFDIRNKNNPLLYVKYKLAKYYDETIKDNPLTTYRLGRVLALLEECGLEAVRKERLGFPRNALSPLIVIEARKV